MFVDRRTPAFILIIQFHRVRAGAYSVRCSSTAAWLRLFYFTEGTPAKTLCGGGRPPRACVYSSNFISKSARLRVLCAEFIDNRMRAFMLIMLFKDCTHAVTLCSVCRSPHACFYFIYFIQNVHACQDSVRCSSITACVLSVNPRWPHGNGLFFSFIIY